MTTFIAGLIILILGGVLYGNFVERIFKPDDRLTPAIKNEDGVDFVPMSKFKNALINLLNIAGTGPISVSYTHLALLYPNHTNKAIIIPFLRHNGIFLHIFFRYIQIIYKTTLALKQYF